ncbi:CD98 heavy chain [Oratosquilla oratoria]|uniref:CD98 heavy chain n=1 Tax=Oratosquilla oratoria TaxID=337810 RepID=UPI003F760F08
MTEDKNGVDHGAANAETEMAPQEDGTKVPLTTDNVEVKFSSNESPNGDAKVDIGNTVTFNGLTKEELMKFGNDPFWVRLRWFLCILFWAGWLAMLVMAIVIIIQAPQCKPPPTMDWVKEAAIVEHDVNQIESDEKDVVELAKELNMKVYVPGLLNEENFLQDPVEFREDVEALLKAAMEANIFVVTDFIPLQVGPANLLGNQTDFLKPGTEELDFENEKFLDKLEMYLEALVDKGIQGFVTNTDDEIVKNATYAINSHLKEHGNGVIGHGVLDAQQELKEISAESLKEFIRKRLPLKEDEHNDRPFLKFNPVAARAIGDDDKVRLATLVLMLAPTTPIFQGFAGTKDLKDMKLLKELSSIRMQKAIKFGELDFGVASVEANSTDETVAFTRLLKGTPGYAVAVNMDPANNVTVSFADIKGVGTDGNVVLRTLEREAPTKYKLDAVTLGPNEGLVLQFAPKF